MNRVHEIAAAFAPVYVKNDWRWAGRVPSVYEIEEQIRRLVGVLATEGGGYISCGRITVYRGGGDDGEWRVVLEADEGSLAVRE